MCKLYRETSESMGYMKSWELVSKVHIQVKTVFAFIDMDPPVHLTSRPLCQDLKPFFEDIFPTGWGDCNYRVWFGAEPKNECESDQPMRAQLGSTPFPVWGRSSSFYTFFQDCVRGQHLCLAQVERSSLHTKTSEFRSLLTLFLR